MTKERRYIKFEGYMYVPDDKDDYKAIRRYLSTRDGHITVFDETNKAVVKKKVFHNTGQMIDVIMKEFSKRVQKRLPTKRRII